MPIETWETPRTTVRGSVIDDPELKQALTRANSLAAQGQYREARELVRVLRMTHPAHADVLTGLDEAFFDAEAERNRQRYRANYDFVFAPPSGLLGTMGACLVILGIYLVVSVWPALRKDGLRGTYTYTVGRVNRRTVTAPVGPRVGWAVVWGVAGIVLLHGAYQLHLRED